MELRAGYKQTEVGVIPEDWSSRKLGELATFRTGPFGSALHKSDYTSNGIPIVNPMHILDGEIVPTQSMTITEAAATALSEFRLKAGEVVIGRRGDMGRCAVVRYEHAGWLCGTGSMIVRPSAGLETRFLQRVLSSPVVISAIEDTSVGSTMINLNQATLGGLTIQVPPVAEQRAIATALSDVDALLAKIDQLIAKKRDLKQAAMQHLLTGQTRLPGFSGEWGVRRLEDVLSRMANGAVYKATHSRGIQITRIETIADGTIDYSRTGVAEYSTELDRYKVMPGDILFSHINSVDHIGKVAIFNGEQPLYHGMNLLLLRTNTHADCNFIYLWFTSLPTRRLMRNLAKQAVSQASINTKELKALDIRLPPLPEQTAIAVVLSDMDAELTTLEARRDKTRALKQGMMQALLTGRIRLAGAN